MPEFERENRYIVFKIADIEKHLSEEQRQALCDAESTINFHRQQEGRGLLITATVESDWPEYEPTWQAIEQRVTGNDICNNCLAVLGDWDCCTTKYKFLLRVTKEMAHSNGFGIKPMNEWPDLSSENFDIAELEALATNLTEEELPIFADGEETETQKLIDKYGAIKLHDFLYEVFEGELHESIGYR